jgi:hypothetical protein
VDILEWQSVRTINEWLEKQRFKFKINPKHLAPLKNTCLHYNGQEYTLRHYNIDAKGNTLRISAEVWNDKLLPISSEPRRPHRRVPQAYLTKSLIITVNGDLIDRQVVNRQTLFCRKPILKRDCSPENWIIW